MTTASKPRLPKAVLNRFLCRAGFTDFYTRQDGPAVTLRVRFQDRFRAVTILQEAGFEWIIKEDGPFPGKFDLTFKVAERGDW